MTDRIDPRRLAAKKREHDRRLLDAFVFEPNGCWTWQLATTAGYGVFCSYGRQIRAHRAMYETLVGPIPEGLHLDHLCRNPTCVNPDHVEPVTLRENVLRGVGACAQNARKSHCKHGHEFTPENTIVYGAGWRRCRTCETKRSHARNRRDERLRRRADAA